MNEDRIFKLMAAIFCLILLILAGLEHIFEYLDKPHYYQRGRTDYCIEAMYVTTWLAGLSYFMALLIYCCKKDKK